MSLHEVGPSPLITDALPWGRGLLPLPLRSLPRRINHRSVPEPQGWLIATTLNCAKFCGSPYKIKSDVDGLLSKCVITK